jgi:hypothetical protein
LREKIFHFDHERIPERIVHARGSAAHGFFQVYESLSDITAADIFQRSYKKGYWPLSTPRGADWSLLNLRVVPFEPNCQTAHWTKVMAGSENGFTVCGSQARQWRILRVGQQSRCCCTDRKQPNSL